MEQVVLGDCTDSGSALRGISGRTTAGRIAPMRTKPFSELSDRILQDPVRRARIELMQRAVEDAIDLTEARENQGLTQQQLAEKLGVTQANISRIEHEEDLYLSTLRAYMESLRGEMQVKAVFEDQEVYLDVPSKP